MATGPGPAGNAVVKLMPPHQRHLAPELRVSDGLPREVDTAVNLAEFLERVNDAMG
jgi:hypothetical protein